MSELFDKQVNAQKESLKKKLRGSRKPTKKCAMKMKESRRKKNDGCLKYFVGRKEFIGLVWKARVMDIKRLQLNDS